MSQMFICERNTMITVKPDGYLSVQEAMELLGLCRRTIIRIIQRQQVKSVKLVNKRVYIEKESLLKYGGNNE